MDYTNALAQSDPNAPIPVHQIPRQTSSSPTAGINGIVQQLMMMKMMKGGPKAGLMGQPRPPDPVMGTGYGASPDPVMGTGYVSPMTQQMRGRGI